MNENQKSLPEIIIVNRSILQIIVCTNIPPERINEIPEKINAIDTCGTQSGWTIPDFIEYPQCKPLKCDKYPDRWHYALLA